MSVLILTVIIAQRASDVCHRNVLSTRDVSGSVARRSFQDIDSLARGGWYCVEVLCGGGRMVYFGNKGAAGAPQRRRQIQQSNSVAPARITAGAAGSWARSNTR
jgi:hypothetical protein